MFTLFCQLGFPRSYREQLYFFRECGKVRLVFDAGVLPSGGEFIQTALPYGVLPRSILMDVFSYAVRYKITEIYLGKSAARLMRRLGLRPVGGKRGNYANLNSQLNSLLALHVE